MRENQSSLMSSSIHSLSPEIINLIAAGEVIDSVAAAVRELVENALDAGANRLTIALNLSGWRLQVVDNGKGMSLADLRCCANPHSTSKIDSLADLWKISSLGFRGEALHSLTQVADLDIASRPNHEENAGWRIYYKSQGERQPEETAAIAPGTIVTVTNLFGKIPVRRQALPSLSQQLKSVQTLLQNIALCHPHVTWQIWQDEQLWFNISPGKTAQEILPQFLKNVHFNDLQFLSQPIESFPASQDKIEIQPASIELVLGLPDRCHRRRSDWVKVAINGRVVRSPDLEQGILTAFSRTLPRDRFPVCFLHLKICPSQIDWNRHPAKAEIYLHNLDFWQEKVAEAIEQALRLVPQTAVTTIQNQRVKKLLKVSEEKSTYRIAPKSPTDLGLMQLQAVGQVRNTYIVAEHASGLWLVEQHIAHERILYEQLQDEWKLITLEIPIVLSQISSHQIEQLQGIGLVIESFGEQMWAVRTVPEMLSLREDCQDALIELSLGGDLQTAQVATACRSAIRNGTRLDLLTMQDLLDRWKMTRNPRTCPHGRPIYLSLEETSLARFFRRHWVIGKSHGI